MPTKVKKPPADYGSGQLRTRLRIKEWQLNSLIRHGLLENPPSRRWSAAVVDELEARLPEALEAIGPQGPLGARRCAALAAELLDVEVDGADIEELVERGLLSPAVDYLGRTIEYEDKSLYDLLHVRELVLRERDLVEQLVAERKTWLESSRSWRELREQLGWSADEMRRVTDERRVKAGRFHRIALADAEALLGDEELDDAVRGARLVNAFDAAQHAELRPIDFQYCRDAGWIAPAAWSEMKISRSIWVDVPKFRVADVEALVETLAEMPGVSLEELRGLKKGEPSPLRHLVRRRTSRATFVRGFAADLGEKYGVEVKAGYSDRYDRWTLSWALDNSGAPSEDVVREAIMKDKDLRDHSRQIVLKVVCPEVG